MGERKTLKCFECKQSFLKEELVMYASPRARIMHNYCPKCLKEKVDRDQFSDKVCQIFGIKTPGPRIWTERKRLQEKYGYTDNVIIRCLDYIYNVEKKKKLEDTLFLINPVTVEKMKQYEKVQAAQSLRMAAATQTVTHEYIAPIQENTKNNKVEYDPDEWLD